MPSLPLALALYTEKSRGRGPCPAGFLRERKWARPWPHAGTRLKALGMAGQPCPPTKLKYLAVTVMTAECTVLAKSVRFLEHVSPGCCAGIASVVPVSWSYRRESVHIKLLVSPVSFSHNNVRLLMVYSPYGKFAYRATCRFRD